MYQPTPQPSPGAFALLRLSKPGTLDWARLRLLCSGFGHCAVRDEPGIIHATVSLGWRRFVPWSCWSARRRAVAALRLGVAAGVQIRVRLVATTPADATS